MKSVGVLDEQVQGIANQKLTFGHGTGHSTLIDLMGTTKKKIRAGWKQRYNTKIYSKDFLKSVGIAMNSLMLGIYFSEFVQSNLLTAIPVPNTCPTGGIG